MLLPPLLTLPPPPPPQDMKPPKELFLQVRALVDCGEVATESGFVTLSRNTTHYLRRSDVEHLIKQGMLEQIEE